MKKFINFILITFTTFSLFAEKNYLNINSFKNKYSNWTTITINQIITCDTKEEVFEIINNYNILQSSEFNTHNIQDYTEAKYFIIFTPKHNDYEIGYIIDNKLEMIFIINNNPDIGENAMNIWYKKLHIN